ncbi:MAG TPA: diaminopimelate decarboxylase [Mobilitalea sp.]|nr:diaminopimelate decarboxylase [Mobilitalea sp.]
MSRSEMMYLAQIYNALGKNMKSFPLNIQELHQVISKYPTPFYIYDEKAIRDNIRRLYKAFSWNPGFKEYFAVKSTPNPHILKIFKEEDCGVDCSSETELILADSCAFSENDIMFTSNVTSKQEFIKARSLNAIINLDDVSHIDYLKKCAGIPELICFRLNLGGKITYQDKVIVNYEDSKFGFTMEQFIEGMHYLKDNGVKHFGLHCQFASHRTETEYIVDNTRRLFQIVVNIYNQTGIKFDFINLAGGLGIPYMEAAPSADIDTISLDIKEAYEEILAPAGLTPIPLYLEFGIFMTGPYGYFISSVQHIKRTNKTFIGLDASTNSFMSPSRYTDYYHITVAGKETEESNCIYDVTGSLCENRDRFAVARSLPHIELGDILIFHDAGAYTYSHSNNFNGKLRPAELLLCIDGSVKSIRRAEQPADYFATLDYPIKLDSIN